eukprot:RCo039038
MQALRGHGNVLLVAAAGAAKPVKGGALEILSQALEELRGARGRQGDAGHPRELHVDANSVQHGALHQLNRLLRLGFCAELNERSVPLVVHYLNPHHVAAGPEQLEQRQGRHFLSVQVAHQDDPPDVLGAPGSAVLLPWGKARGKKMRGRHGYSVACGVVPGVGVPLANVHGCQLGVVNAQHAAIGENAVALQDRLSDKRRVCVRELHQSLMDAIFLEDHNSKDGAPVLREDVVQNIAAHGVSGVGDVDVQNAPREVRHVGQALGRTRLRLSWGLAVVHRVSPRHNHHVGHPGVQPTGIFGVWLFGDVCPRRVLDVHGLSPNDGLRTLVLEVI